MDIWFGYLLPTPLHSLVSKAPLAKVGMLAVVYEFLEDFLAASARLKAAVEEE